MELDDEPWEIARDLTRKQYKTLAAVQHAGGEATTSEITSSDTDLYNTLVNSHFRRMTDADLVKRLDPGDGEDASKIQRVGYTYRLTDRGREVLSAAQEDYGMTSLEEGTVRRRFDRIEDRLASVEEQVKGRNANDDSADLEKQVTDLRQSHEDLIEDVKRLAYMVEEIKDEIGRGSEHN